MRVDRSGWEGGEKSTRTGRDSESEGCSERFPERESTSRRRRVAGLTLPDSPCKASVSAPPLEASLGSISPPSGPADLSGEFSLIRFFDWSL